MPTGGDTSRSASQPLASAANPAPSVRLTAVGIDRQLGRVGGVRQKPGLALRFGANLRRLRTRRGVGQRALAEAIGRDRQTICRWEAGQRTPSLPDLIALAAALRCKPAALLEGLRAED